MSILKIPFFGLDRQYATIRDEILTASDQVYKAGQVLDGEYTKKFEQAIAARTNRKYAIAVNSCTQGLIFAVMAASNSNTPSKVLIPNISFPATLNAAKLGAGSTPTFCEVDDSGLIDLTTLSKSTNIDIIMYVNLYGTVVDWEKFSTVTSSFNKIPWIIEDAAQSFGASYKGISSGKLGDISVLSFDPTKNLPNYGSGGMVLTDDCIIASTIKSYRDNGKNTEFIVAGTNSKMSESDCAQMLVKLQYFDSWQKRRDAIAKYYIDAIGQYVDVITPAAGVVHAWHKFVIKVKNRKNLITKLNNAGVSTRVHYQNTLSKLQDNDNAVSKYPISDKLVNECLSLPIYPELTDYEIEYIATSLVRCYTF